MRSVTTKPPITFRVPTNTANVPNTNESVSSGDALPITMMAPINTTPWMAFAPLIKGGGGGQKTLATAGGQDASNLQQVIEKVKGLL